MTIGQFIDGVRTLSEDKPLFVERVAFEPVAIRVTAVAACHPDVTAELFVSVADVERGEGYGNEPASAVAEMLRMLESQLHQVGRQPARPLSEFSGK